VFVFRGKWSLALGILLVSVCSRGKWSLACVTVWEPGWGCDAKFAVEVAWYGINDDGLLVGFAACIRHSSFLFCYDMSWYLKKKTVENNRREPAPRFEN